MKDVKFRIWCSDNGDAPKMVYLDKMEMDNGLWFHNPEEHTSDIHELMQFTGIKDKKGKEIYEGDVCLLSGKFTYTVGFEDGKFVCYHLNTHAIRGTIWGNLHRALDHDFEEYDFIVIGNIYENPELLNQ